MSLDFDYSQCGKTAVENAALSTHPADHERWHPVGDSLVWLSLTCGFNRITQETVDKVWERIDLYQRITGHAIYGFIVEGKRHELFLTAPDVERYIGLSTNATPKTDAQFYSFLRRIRAENPLVDPERQSAFDWVAAHYEALGVVKKAAA